MGDGLVFGPRLDYETGHKVSYGRYAQLFLDRTLVGEKYPCMPAHKPNLMANCSSMPSNEDTTKKKKDKAKETYPEGPVLE